MSTDEPTPAEASRALSAAREQRARLLTSEMAPRWLLVSCALLAAAAAIGFGLARDLLPKPAALVVMASCFGVFAVTLLVLGPAGRGGLGRRLGFRARLEPSTRERSILVGLAFVLAIPGSYVAMNVVPALGLPLPQTWGMAFLAAYAFAMVPLQRTLMRWISRRGAR
jgi:hypothetical protein